VAISFRSGQRAWRSGERSEAATEFFGAAIGKEMLDLVVDSLPHRNRASHQVAALGSEFQDAATAIAWVWRHLDQPATLKRLQGGGKGGSIHCEQRRDRSHGGRLGPIQGHQERKLAIGQLEGTQCFIESPCQGAGGTLYVKTEAAVSYEERGFVRKRIVA
jgi:hypothetical protein